MEIILLFWSIFGGVSTALAASACMKYFGKNSIPAPVVILVLIMGVIATLFSIIHAAVPLSAVKMVFLLCVVVSSVFMYIKEKRIPIQLIGISAAVRFVIAVIEIITLKEMWQGYLLRDFLGLIFGIGIPILINIMFGKVFTNDEIKLFGVMGMFSGYACIYAVLVFAVAASYLLRLFIIYKTRKNVKMPLEPFVMFGYVIMMMLFRV